jgi:hypothetical protein
LSARKENQEGKPKGPTLEKLERWAPDSSKSLNVWVHPAEKNQLSLRMRPRYRRAVAVVEYQVYLDLVARLRRIDEVHGGHLTHLSSKNVSDFCHEELKIVGGAPFAHGH